MSKITFPHFGMAYLPLKLFFEEIGAEAVVPPKNNARTLQMGSLLAPEEMCLPFKLMLGNLMQAYEEGARLVIMPATMGPCRLGEYAELLASILAKEGYDYEWTLLDSPKAIGKKELIRRGMGALSAAGSTVSYADVINKAVMAGRLMFKIDDTESKMRALAGLRETDAPIITVKNTVSGKGNAAPGTENMAQLMVDFRRDLDKSKNLKEGMKICHRYCEGLKNEGIESADKADKPNATVRRIEAADKQDAAVRWIKAADKQDAVVRWIKTADEQDAAARWIKTADEQDAAVRWIKAADKPESATVKVLLIGEIFSMIEPYASHNMEEELLRLGVSVIKPVTISWWLKNTMFQKGKASEYLPYCAGGYAVETVAEAAEAKARGCDGILQFLPAGCMPEIISKSILPEISCEYGIPVSTIIFDEMNANAGYRTRLEAFVDMLEMRKAKGDLNEVPSRN